MRTVHGYLNASAEWCTNSAGETHRMIGSGCNPLLRESLGKDTHIHTHTPWDRHFNIMVWDPKGN